MNFNDKLLNELQDSMKKDINSMLEKQINEYVKKQMKQIKNKYLKEMVSVDTYPTEEELDTMKNNLNYTLRPPGHCIKGDALDGMMRIRSRQGWETDFYGITSMGHIIRGWSANQLQKAYNQHSYKDEKIQPLTNEYIEIIKCIISHLTLGIITTTAHHVNMKWGDELMDIFRKYHPRREISELEGNIDSIMKKLILKTHPDKGGDENDFKCVRRTHELIKEI